MVDQIVLSPRPTGTPKVNMGGSWILLFQMVLSIARFSYDEAILSSRRQLPPHVWGGLGWGLQIHQNQI